MEKLIHLMIFSENLEKIMVAKEKTQKDLIEDLGIPSSTVSGWVNGIKYPRINKIQILADYFGISKSDLIEERKSENSNLKMEYLIKLKMAIIDADRKMENNYAISNVDIIDFQNATDKCMKVIDRILDKEVI